MKRSKLPFILGTSSVILLVCTVMAITLFIWKIRPTQVSKVIETVVQTEHIYVFLGAQQTDPAQTESFDKKQWTVREYGEKIGVFDEADELIDIIDVYTKTLPEADRLMLKEGIVIDSEKELNSLIEDYSS